MPSRGGEAGGGGATGAVRGGRTGAEAGGGVERDKEDVVADDEEEGKGTDIVMEGIEAGGGRGAVDKDEEFEEDDKLKE